MPGPIDDSHPTLSDQLQAFVLTEGCEHAGIGAIRKRQQKASLRLTRRGNVGSSYNGIGHRTFLRFHRRPTQRSSRWPRSASAVGSAAELAIAALDYSAGTRTRAS